MRLVFLLVLLLAAGCSKPGPARKTVARVVSLSPSTTEAVFAVGAGGDLVGRSRYCNWPPEVLALPQVGGYVDPNFEAVLALKPDLVVGARGPAGSAIATKLEQQGIQTYFPETESFEAIDAMIAGVGERTGHAREASERLAKLHAAIADIERAVAKQSRVRVLLVFGLAPISVAGPRSFAAEMLRRAGGENVVADGEAYPTLGMERVLALDPDVIVNAAMMEERAHERLGPNAPGWQKVRAVKEGRVTTITDESVLRPGPRIDEGLRRLAHALHPAAVP